MNKRIIRAFKDPWLAGVNLLGRSRPTWLLKRYSRLAYRDGFDGVYMIFSFDCDTDRDAEVAIDVQKRLLNIGINPIYAVPGRTLMRSASIYQEISAMGSEFINHGYQDHAFWDEDTKQHRSCFFYDQLSKEEIIHDIHQGHKVIMSILKKTPRGFRAPHFGTFQSEKDLHFLHQTLRKLGYSYSSSTVPYYGLRYGPLHSINDDFVEIPVSGCCSNPLHILDSWAFFSAPERQYTSEDYYQEFYKIVDFFCDNNLSALLNFYADPSHIAGHSRFFDMMDYAASKINIINSYRELFHNNE